MRTQDWAAGVTASALAAAVAAAARRRARPALAFALVAVGADVAGRVASRRNPRPIPASLRWSLRTPHPAEPLRRALDPNPGERVLEVGPGLGQYAVCAAEWLAPNGDLDVVDVQQEMLDATMERARQHGVANITPALADASGVLPYPDGSFDAAYLTGVLGEITNPDQALSELHRVLKPDGRLVVGEVAFDPDFVSLNRLRTLAGAAGFRFDRRDGSRLTYFSRFTA